MEFQKIERGCHYAIEHYGNLKRALEVVIETYNETTFRYNLRISGVYDLIVKRGYGEISLDVLAELKSDELESYFADRRFDVNALSEYFLRDIKFFQANEAEEMAQLVRKSMQLYREYLTVLDDLYLNCAFESE